MHRDTVCLTDCAFPIAEYRNGNAADPSLHTLVSKESSFHYLCICAFGRRFLWVPFLVVWLPVHLGVSVDHRHAAGSETPQRMDWAAAGGGFGLLFGLFFSLIYLLAGGIPTALAWWIAGIPFDILHGVSNFILIRILFQPLDRLYHTIA